MKDIRLLWQKQLHNAISALYATDPPLLEDIVVEIPPKPEMGDLAFPMFSYAKSLHTSPVLIAQNVARELAKKTSDKTKILALGPYVNLCFSRPQFIATTLESILTQGDSYGRNPSLAHKRIMVEFSAPNTNKPLHLGHLRNNTLGEALARILKANGAEVKKVNLINDRGIHICKSMLAYQKFSQGVTPEEKKQKSDHFVGDYYVKFAQWAKEDPTAEEQVQVLLNRWEEGEEEVLTLWKKMNQWATEGIFQTYQRTGIHFDKVYLESQTYHHGKKEILKGLAAGAFQQREDKAIIVDLPWKDPQNESRNAQKVLLRADGTSIYLTQDIGTAIARHTDWDFDQLIYVVANEQNYHFKVLFYVLQKLGLSWAKDLFHLSYGMVNLPHGRMKSREGTVVDADHLIDELCDMVIQEIRSKDREKAVDNLEETAELIALGALHYYLLQPTASKDMVFDPKESLSFHGNTGPYLQYTGARISSILAKNTDIQPEIKPQFLNSTQEWELIKLLSQYPQVVEQAGKDKDPSILAGFAYDLSKGFSRFYHECPVLNAETNEIMSARLALLKAVKQVQVNIFGLLNIPFLQIM